MEVRALSLMGFRNFEYVEKLEFPKDALLVAAAPNATGKTNFLESLVVLLRAKSFRAELEECVRWGEDEMAVSGVVARREKLSRVSVRYQRGARKLRVEEDQQPASPVTFYAAYPIVLFLPEDTFLFYRGPGGRRNFMNHVLVSEPTYLAGLVQYQRALRQRNVALKTARTFGEVAAWTQLLAEQAAVVWRHREALAAFLRSHVDEAYAAVSGEERAFEVRFRPGATRPGEFWEELKEAWPDESRYHYTLFGPHRDDIAITTGGREAASALSRGQMRGLAVALKIAAWRFLKHVTGEAPVLLLDEVLSELDEARQAHLLDHLPQSQTLLTCTKVPKELRGRSDVHLLDLRALLRVPQSYVTEAVHAAA